MNKNGEDKRSKITPAKQNSSISTPVRNTNNKHRQVIKSPSDMTIYAPALMLNNMTSPAQVQEIVGRIQQQKDKLRQDEVINKISDFVDSIRIEQDRIEGKQAQVQQQPTNGVLKELEEVKARTDKMILDAEHFKASISPPQGMVPHGSALFDRRDDRSLQVAQNVNVTQFARSR